MPKRLAALRCALLLILMAGTAAADVVVIVPAQSPVNTLTRAELVDIYLGRLNRLPNGEPVVPIDQADGSPAHEEFYNDYLRRSPAQIKAHWSRLIFTGRGQPPRTVANGAATARVVAENPNAIGYVEPGLVNERLRVVPIE